MNARPACAIAFGPFRFLRGDVGFGCGFAGKNSIREIVSHHDPNYHRRAPDTNSGRKITATNSRKRIAPMLMGFAFQCVLQT